jgi:hypothetical protein
MVGAAPAAFYHHYTAHQQPQQQQQQQQQPWQQLGLDGVPGLSVGLCGSSSGLVVCSGHSATYVVPVYKVSKATAQIKHAWDVATTRCCRTFVLTSASSVHCLFGCHGSSCLIATTMAALPGSW